jgi:hypothetical protein
VSSCWNILTLNLECIKSTHDTQAVCKWKVSQKNMATANYEKEELWWWSGSGRWLYNSTTNARWTGWLQTTPCVPQNTQRTTVILYKSFPLHLHERTSIIFSHWAKWKYKLSVTVTLVSVLFLAICFGFCEKPSSDSGKRVKKYNLI